MSERESILARIKEALSIAAPKRYLGHEEHVETADPRQYRDFLPNRGSTDEERLQLFAQQSEALKTQFISCSSEAEVSEKLAQIATEEKWSRVAYHAATEGFAKKLSLELFSTDQSFDAKELEKCNVGISACEALIAQSGSVLVTTLSSGGRALSVLPPHHVVIARRDQLVGDLSDGFAILRKKYGDKIPAYISFITGPSRTGDIERILVLGAHGPKKLTVFLY